jgi:hypothetical protein
MYGNLILLHNNDKNGFTHRKVDIRVRFLNDAVAVAAAVPAAVVPVPVPVPVVDAVDVDAGL